MKLPEGEHNQFGASKQHLLCTKPDKQPEEIQPCSQIEQEHTEE